MTKPRRSGVAVAAQRRKAGAHKDKRPPKAAVCPCGSTRSAGHGITVYPGPVTEIEFYCLDCGALIE